MKKMIKINNELKEMSFEEVLNKHQGLIYSLTSGVQVGNGLNKLEGEDLQQIFATTAWEVYNAYDIKKNTNFSTLLVTSIKNELVNLRKKVSRNKREAMNDVGYLDNTLKEDEGKTFLDNLADTQTLEEQVFDNYNNDEDILVKCEDIVSKVCRKDKEKEELKLLLLIQDKSMAELANEMGVSRQCLSQKVKRIRSKFQKRLGGLV